MSLQIETNRSLSAIRYACMSVDERVTEDATDELIGLCTEPIFKDAPLINLYKKVQVLTRLSALMRTS
jgi:hypothetical protein